MCTVAQRAALDSMEADLRCRICLDVLGTCGRPERLGCDHAFCRKCLLRSLEVAKSCPLCKEPATRRSMQEDAHLVRLVRAFERVRAAFAAAMASCPSGYPPLQWPPGAGTDAEDETCEPSPAPVVADDETQLGDAPADPTDDASDDAHSKLQPSIPSAEDLGTLSSAHAAILKCNRQQEALRQKLAELLPSLSPDSAMRPAVAAALAKQPSHAGPACAAAGHSGAGLADCRAASATRVSGASGADGEAGALPPPRAFGRSCAENQTGADDETAAAPEDESVLVAETAYDAAVDPTGSWHAAHAEPDGSIERCMDCGRVDCDCGGAGQKTCLGCGRVDCVCAADGAAAKPPAEAALRMSDLPETAGFGPTGPRQFETAPSPDGSPPRSPLPSPPPPTKGGAALDATHAPSQDAPPPAAADAAAAAAPPMGSDAHAGGASALAAPTAAATGYSARAVFVDPPQRQVSTPAPRRSAARASAGGSTSRGEGGPGSDSRGGTGRPEGVGNSADGPGDSGRGDPRSSVATRSGGRASADGAAGGSPARRLAQRSSERRACAASLANGAPAAAGHAAAAGEGAVPVVAPGGAARAKRPAAAAALRDAFADAAAVGEGAAPAAAPGGAARAKRPAAAAAPRDVFDFHSQASAVEARPTAAAVPSPPAATGATGGDCSDAAAPSSAAPLSTEGASGMLSAEGASGMLSSDMCAVCGEEESFEDNLILFCERCGVGVHQWCYAVRRVPADEWLCDPCAAELDVAALECPGCPVRGGAFKRTREGLWGGWAHVVCTLFLPETGFLKPETFTDAAGFDLIPPARKKLKCSLCKGAERKASGAKIQCHHKKCPRAFHVPCAMAAGLHLEIRDEGNLAFCAAHTPGGSGGTPAAKPSAAKKRRKSRLSS